MPQLIEVSHTSKRGSSLRVTIPKKVQEKLGIKEEDIVGFYEEDGLNKSKIQFMGGPATWITSIYYQLKILTMHGDGLNFTRRNRKRHRYLGK
jgi:hypothetical protein